MLKLFELWKKLASGGIKKSPELEEFKMLQWSQVVVTRQLPPHIKEQNWTFFILFRMLKETCPPKWGLNDAFRAKIMFTRDNIEVAKRDSYGKIMFSQTSLQHTL